MTAPAGGIRASLRPPTARAEQAHVAGWMRLERTLDVAKRPELRARRTSDGTRYQLGGAPTGERPAPPVLEGRQRYLGTTPVTEEVARLSSWRSGRLPVSRESPEFPVGSTSEATVARWRLRDELRHLQPHKRARACGRQPMGPVAIGHGWQRGVVTCANPHSCPVCSGRMRVARAVEVARCVRAWTERDNRGKRRTVGMLTLTVRHGFGDELGELRSGMMRAWRALWKGRAGRELRRAVPHYVRALDLTYGPHGWHPHIHALFFVDGVELPDEWIERVQELWSNLVARELGESRRPEQSSIGAHWTAQPSQSTYLLKLGLEVGSIATKQAKPGHWNPWQIAGEALKEDRYTAQHDASTARVWRGRWKAYVEGMAGARALVWSRHVRALAALGDDDDVDAQERGAELEPPEPPERPWVVVVPSGDWSRFVGRPWGVAPSALMSASVKGFGAVLRCLEAAGCTVVKREIGAVDALGTVGTRIFCSLVSVEESLARGELRERRRRGEPDGFVGAVSVVRKGGARNGVHAPGPDSFWSQIHSLRGSARPGVASVPDRLASGGGSRAG